MGKSLIITEKPSVAQEFAKILGVSGRKDGYIENDKYVITWCVGHLVEMLYPEDYDIRLKKWRLEDLPFLPEEYKYGVIPNVAKQYNVVHGMLQREDIDTVYWAGDAGKEGQTIEENIRNYGGVRPGMTELRVWIDSQTEEEILRGIREAKPMSDYANLGKSGIMRTIEDYAMGINFSRAMSVKYGRLLNDAAGTDNYTAIAVGRVMTCVLGMVVIREREIRNFTENYFYRVIGSFTEAEIDGEWKAVEGSDYFGSPKLYKENGFSKEEDANALIAALSGKEARILAAESGTSKKRAPLLFNLAELQAECSKRFKISPDETLQVAQSLYEKKLTTYPRTDARVLSTAIAKEIGKNLSKLKGYTPTAAYTEKILQTGSYKNIAKSAYTDDSKITDHYAIIPTGQLTELSKLSDLEAKVFDLIVRRFLSIFYPPAEYRTAKFTVGIENEQFFASGKELVKPGFLEIAGKPIKEDESEEEKESSGLLKIIDTLKVGETVPVNGFSLKEGKTSPPKRYTSGSMILAMENAGQLIEDEELREQIRTTGIGTSATRAEIIDKLVRVGYLNLNKKTQILTPQTIGEMIFEIVSLTVPQLLNPTMTANWEKGLDGITKGTVPMDEYRAKLEAFIRNETLGMIGKDIRETLLERIRPLTGKGARGAAARRVLPVKCPACGGDMVTTPFGYGCANYQKDGSGCKFSIGTLAGKDLEEETVIKLLETGASEPISGFKSKKGKKFDAVLKLKKEEGKVDIVFSFDEIGPAYIEDLACPVCGGRIEKTPFGFVCEHRKDEENPCYFSVGKICEKELTVEQVRQLITERKTETIRGFKSKAGKKFDAVIKLTEDEETKRLKMSFDFGEVEAKVVKDVKCPLCGGAIIVTSFGYSCEKRDYRDPSTCQFAVGKICDKLIAEAQLKELLSNGVTSTIRGFKSPKTGKRFDACLKMEKTEDGKCNITFDFENVEARKVKDVVCPLCGGEIVQTRFGFACANHDRTNPESCAFTVGSIASVKLKEDQLKTLLTTGKVGPIEGFVSKTGMMFAASLKLEDGKIKFDFPEKNETDLPCPKCGRMLSKTDRQMSCECGLKFFYVVGQKELEHDTIAELLKDGKTQSKVTGFVSKAGNAFDAFLVFDGSRISYDFDRKEEPAEGQPDAADASAVSAKDDAAPDEVTHSPDDTPLPDDIPLPEEPDWLSQSEDGLPWQ